MNLILTAPCPYCWQNQEISYVIGESKEFVQDCDVCCHPLLFKVFGEESENLFLEAHKEND